MALTQTPGSLTVDGTEKNLFASQVTLQHYACWIFLHNMGATDVLTIRIYVNDEQSTDTERLYIEDTYSGTQDVPSIFLPFVPTDSYRVTAQRDAGSFTTLTWARQDLA